MWVLSSSLQCSHCFLPVLLLLLSSLLIVKKLASPTEVEISSMNLMGLVDILKVFNLCLHENVAFGCGNLLGVLKSFGLIWTKLVIAFSCGNLLRVLKHLDQSGPSLCLIFQF